ncbi:hypothetical protein [Sorangium sp. So ce362]|uniref:hypothetical protein n=1 Tax=Sorangium sp. So ce362 TaxID=3133303 RepID=UPI003F60F44B
MKGSLTENPRDLLNCAECLPIGNLLRDGWTVTESQALRRDQGNDHASCDPCENCQALYNLKTAAEKVREEQAAARAAEEKEREAKLREQARQNAEAQQRHQAAKVDLEQDVRRVADQLTPAEKRALNRLYKSKHFPKAKLDSTWMVYRTDDEKRARLKEAEKNENPKKK